MAVTVIRMPHALNHTAPIQAESTALLIHEVLSTAQIMVVSKAMASLHRCAC